MPNSVKLTDAVVKKLRTDDRVRTFFDSEIKGFGLRCSPPSTKSPDGYASWVVVYRPYPGGRAMPKRRLVIGPLAQLKTAEAREKAREILTAVRNRADPALERREARQSATVKDLSIQYQSETAVGRKDRTVELYQSYWDLWILPVLGASKARDITKSDVAKLHRRIGADHTTTANRCVTLLAHFFTWASEHGEVPPGLNPAVGVTRYKESARERFLSPEELGRLGSAIVEAETAGIPWEEPEGEPSKHWPKNEANRRTILSPHAAAAIRLLLLTGARLREILHLRWSEVDLGRGLLFLPDSKTGKKTIILSGPAMTVIQGIPKVGDFVIAGDNPEKPRADLQKPWALVCRAAALKGVRLHDLRHTFASYGASGGLGLPVIGGLLGHADPKTTARYAHLANDPLRRASNLIGAEISAAMAGQGRGI